MSAVTEQLAGQSFWFIHNLATVKVSGDQTGEAWSMVEIVGPRGDMPPLHVHHREDEVFYVLEGRMTLFVGNEQIELTDGDCAFAPRGVPHVYRVDSERARWLGIASPAGFERFVAEAAVPARELELPRGEPVVEPERLNAIAAGYGIEILGPPGTLPA
jgi:mannose-6-phosphate isomerase-like protein (cupin superfamily)